MLNVFRLRIGFLLGQQVDKTDQRKLVFKTFFERPFKFRFEWSQEIPIEPLLSERNFNIVWSDGTQVAHSYDCEPGPFIEENLVYAIAGATGISMGSAFEAQCNLNVHNLSNMTDVEAAEVLNRRKTERVAFLVKGAWMARLLSTTVPSDCGSCVTASESQSLQLRWQFVMG